MDNIQILMLLSMLEGLQVTNTDHEGISILIISTTLKKK